MEIRSVTLFCEPRISAGRARAFLAAARAAFSHPVQTTRLATTPFPEWWPESGDDGETAVKLARQWQTLGADYISVGPVLLRHGAEWVAKLPHILGANGVLFASAEVGDQEGQIDPSRAWELAGVIQQASELQPNGFGNLYFTALANCAPGAPFFPVAYHGGGEPGFALALEAADLAVEAVVGAKSLAETRQRLVDAVEREAIMLTAVADQLAEAHGIAFQGLDFSLAPFPTADKSLAGAMEALGLPWLGAPGSLFTAAFITEALGRANFRRAGFSGLMLPVLEDSVLAERAAQGRVGVSDLLSYAAVCGVGLDTVPLPGDISQATLSGILLDVAALAARLNKPLTARLMPIPGLAAGDPVQFDFPYFADSRVMAAPEPGIRGLLRGGEQLIMERIHK
jgi:uncharacterized protein (UPF0210 family)